MKKSWLVAAVAIGAGAWLAAGARSEEGAGGGGGMPPPQKSIKDTVFAKGILGSWTLTTKGATGEGTGTATFALGVGDTAILETYRNDTKTGEQTFSFQGHGIYKVSDDGKTCTCWWIDNMGAEPMKLTGPCDEKGAVLTGDSPQGPMEVKIVKIADGWETHISSGGHEFMVDTLKKVK